MVEILVSSCDQPFDKFVHAREHLNPNPEVEKSIFKGGVPVQLFWLRIRETALPRSFHNTMSGTPISDEGYARA